MSGQQHVTSESAMISSGVGLHTMAVPFCRRGIPGGSWPHLACRPLTLTPCRHHFNRQVWTYRWHWDILKQVCMHRRAGPADFVTFFLPPRSMIYHHAGFTHHEMWSQFLSSPCGHPKVKRWGSGVSTETRGSNMWWLASVHKAVSLSW